MNCTNSSTLEWQQMVHMTKMYALNPQKRDLATVSLATVSLALDIKREYTVGTWSQRYFIYLWLEICQCFLYSKEIMLCTNCFYKKIYNFRRNTQYYGGYHNNHKVISWMWDVLDKDFTRDEKGLFLKVIHVFYATSLVVRALSFTHVSMSVCPSVHPSIYM